MKQILLQNNQDEHSDVTVQKEGRCVLCNKYKEKVLVCDNSDGDNNGIVFCLKCCIHYLK